MSSVIPDSWATQPLGDVINQLIDFRGRTPKKLGMEWGNGNIRALSANNVQMGKVNFNKECYLASEELYEKWMTKGDTEKGDVLFTMEAPLGNVALVPDDKKYILSQRVILLKAVKERMMPEFLFQQLRSDAFQDILRENATGSTALGIQQKRLVTLDITIPPLPEQQKIAAILTSVDDVIEKTQAQIDKLKDLKTGMMQELLTRGVGVDGKPHTEFKDSPVGKIPQGWDVVKMDSICHKITDGEHQTPKRSIDGYYLLSARNVRDGFISLSNVDYIQEAEYQRISKRIRPKQGDILISCSGSVGRVAVVPANLEFSLVRSVAILQLDNTSINSEFMAFQISATSVQYQIEQSLSQQAQANLFQGAIKNLIVVVPPLCEQQHISRVVNSVVNKINVQQHKLEATKSMKKALMQDLLTGKVRVKVDS